MTTLRTIKDLTHQAISLLEVSYCSGRLDVPLSSSVGIASSSPLAVQHRELIAFCELSEKTGALLLANMVAQLALGRKTPTLLVASRCSPAVFVVNLLLWRAGIDLEEAVNPVWGKNEFARLTVAAGEVASAPLLVVRSSTHATFRNLVHTAVANYGTRWVVIDAAGTESFERLTKISCELGVPITITALASVGSWRCASGRRSGRNGIE